MNNTKLKVLLLVLGVALSGGHTRAVELRPSAAIPAIDVHGFVSQGYLHSSDYNYLGESSDGSAKFFEAGLNFSMNPWPRTRVAVQGFAYTVGKVGEYDPRLDYALLEYTFNDHVGIRAGRIRRPEGIYNHIQDVDLARTWVLLPQGMYDTRQRDFLCTIDGAEVFGSVGLGRAGSLSYELYGGVINYAKNGGVARWVASALPSAPIGQVVSLNKDMPMYGTQLWWNTPVSGLRVGAADGTIRDMGYVFSIRPPYGPGAISTVGHLYFQRYSVEYVVNSWTFQSEFYYYKWEDPWIAGGRKILDAHLKNTAWYVGATRRINRWLEIGTYYTENLLDSTSYPGASDKYQRDAALSFRFDPTDWLIFKVEGHRLQGTSLLQDNHANPVRKENSWWLLAVKTTVSF